LTKCSLHLTLFAAQPEGWIALQSGPKAGLHEYVVKKLPIAEYSVVKKPV